MPRAPLTSPVLAVLGACLAVLGLATLSQAPWLGLLDLIFGGVCFLMAGLQRVLAELRPPPLALLCQAQAVLGFAVLALGAVGVAAGAPAPLPWFTFAFGAALLATIPAFSIDSESDREV